PRARGARRPSAAARMIYSSADTCAARGRGVAQPGSAPALGAGGRRFKSGHPDHISVEDGDESSGLDRNRARAGARGAGAGVQLSRGHQAGRGSHPKGRGHEDERRQQAAHRRGEEARRRGQDPPREREDEEGPRRRHSQGEDGVGLRRGSDHARDALSKFSGQVALITGASSGIGEALAREFARAGASLVLAARRTDRLERLVAELTAGGARAIAARCDVTVDGDPERAAAAAREKFGRLDVVVANAGFGVVGPVMLLTLDDYRRQFETNVFGVLRTIKATLPDVRRARGRIAIIGSVSGHIATPGSSPYAMSKFAVRALAEALGHELAGAGVAVTLVSPGYVASEIRRVDNEGVLRAETP